MVNFGEIIGSSVSWTTTVLFKPFNFKKWLILVFVAFMAGFMASGCNLNLPGGNQQSREQQSQVSRPGAPSVGAVKEGAVTKNAPLTRDEVRNIIVVISVSAAILLALVILFTWLGSRFSFVFLEDVVKNDASIKIPFKTNKELGNSYFFFNLIITAISLVLFGSLVYLCVITLIKAGVFEKAMQDFKQVFQFLAILLPYLFVMLIMLLILALTSLIATNFVVVIMFKEKIKVMQAWAKALSLLRKNIGNFLLYLLIRLGFYVGAGIAYLLAALLCLLVILIPAALIGVLLYFVSRVLPSAYLTLYWIIVAVMAAPPILFIMYCLSCLYLPFAVFFRTFSIKFLGQLDSQYDLIGQNPGT